jgi:murein DD-endopeptidase MepM/ murein hydrolase activator NlpD
MPEDRPRRTHRPNEQRKNKSGWQLIAVQSTSCVVVILLVLLFRAIGGSSFEQLRRSFNKSIMSNSLLATLAALIEPPPEVSGGDTPSSSTTDTKGTNESESEEGSGSENTTSASSTDETSSETNETTSSSASTTSGSPSSSSTAATKTATGGRDIPVSQKKVLYAPAGATFVPLKVNRLAYKPLKSGKVTSRFGYRENPVSGGDSFHQGLDIAAETGAPISAMYFGVVCDVGQSPSYGNYVQIYHGNGIKVLYAHCSQVLVNKDAVIRAGEVVARVGSTGTSTGSHLHVEVTLNGIAYDPSYVIQLNDYA